MTTAHSQGDSKPLAEPLPPNKLGCSVLGGIIGLLLGALLVPFLLCHIFSWSSVPGGRLPYALGMAAFWAFVCYSSAAREIAKRKRQREVAEKFGMTYSFNASEQFDDAVAETLGDIDMVSLTNCVYRSEPGYKLVVGELSTLERNSSRKRRATEGTIAYFESEKLALPQFTLQPEDAVSEMVAEIVGVEDIDFTDHPQFSKSYHLTAVRDDRTRRLFNRDALDYFAAHPGLRVNGKGRGIVISWHAEDPTLERLEEFIRQALEVSALFLQASGEAAVLDLQAPLPRPDVRSQAENMTGLLGACVRRLLITREEVDQFVKQAPPRTLPANIRNRVLGNSTFLIAFGGFFTLVGTILVSVGFSGVLKPPSYAPAVVGLVILAIGLPILVGALRHFRRNKALLRDGALINGSIEKVEKSSFSVNNERQYRVAIRYYNGFQKRTAAVKVYGVAGERASRYMDGAEPVRLLRDPYNPENILWVESLITASLEYD